MHATAELGWMEAWENGGAGMAGAHAIDIHGKRCAAAASFGAYVLFRRPPPPCTERVPDQAAARLRDAFTAPLTRSETVRLDSLRAWLRPVEWTEDLDGEPWRPQRPGWMFAVLIDRNLAAWALEPFDDETVTVGMFETEGRTPAGVGMSKAFAFDGEGWRVIVMSLHESTTLERMSQVERAAIPRWSEAS